MPPKANWPADFWVKIEIESPDECWPWIARLDRTGYGTTCVNRKTRAAHRVAYELVIGSIPPGLDLDHLCHNRDLSCPGGSSCPHRRCCNPAHLEPKTRRANLEASTVAPSTINKAKTACLYGHDFTPENTYVDKHGWRYCRKCQAIKAQRLRDGTRPLYGPLLGQIDLHGFDGQAYVSPETTGRR